MRTRKNAIAPDTQILAISENSCELTRNRGRPILPSMDARGRKIRSARTDLGLTMLQASQRCGVDEATISRLEAGKIPNASFNILSRVARGLGMSLDELHDEAPVSDTVGVAS